MEFNEIKAVIRLLKKKYAYTSRTKFQYRIKILYNYQDKLLEEGINPPKRFIQIHKGYLDNLHLIFATFYKLANKYNLPDKTIQLSWNLHSYIQQALANAVKFCVIGLELKDINAVKSVISNISEALSKFKLEDKKKILSIIKITTKQLDNYIEMWKENQ